ncbi:MAG: hypothetical protein ABIU05_01415 [Nitrospirales bacterium]
MPDSILKFLGEVIAYGGGAAVVAYILFQYLGQKWIQTSSPSDWISLNTNMSLSSNAFV